MGSAQSTVANAQAQAQVSARRMPRRDLKSAEEEEYIYVEGDDPPPYCQKERDVALSISRARGWEKELLADPKNRLALSALSANPATSILASHTATVTDTQIFNVRIPIEGSPVTNQRSSGRCWIFAASNIFRVAIMRQYNLKEFELSQAYLFYWDKIEKANWFLENAIDTASEDLDSRLVQELLSNPVNDGGQWDMAANLVQKYGLVPHTLYPDSYNAKNSRILDTLITTKLREDALTLRRLSKGSKAPSTLASVARAKEKFLQEIHSILTILLGPPPSPSDSFAWEYYDANGKFHKVSKTPLEFASGLSSKDGIRACGGTDVNKLFSLVNDPRNQYDRHLTVDRLGNVVGGRPISYVNVDMDTIKTAAIKMLRVGIPVFFGCDVGKFSDTTSGIMDTALYDYALGFNIRLGMTKSARLQTGESAVTHAMVLTAVHIENDKPVRWRVENSWGDNAGDKGWFVMTDAWMDEFVYQIVVDPRFVDRDVRDVLKQTPISLPLWDPIGALA